MQQLRDKPKARQLSVGKSASDLKTSKKLVFPHFQSELKTQKVMQKPKVQVLRRDKSINQDLQLPPNEELDLSINEVCCPLMSEREEMCGPESLQSPTSS